MTPTQKMKHRLCSISITGERSNFTQAPKSGIVQEGQTDQLRVTDTHTHTHPSESEHAIANTQDAPAAEPLAPKPLAPKPLATKPLATKPLATNPPATAAKSGSAALPAAKTKEKVRGGTLIATYMCTSLRITVITAITNTQDETYLYVDENKNQAYSPVSFD